MAKPTPPHQLTDLYWHAYSDRMKQYGSLDAFKQAVEDSDDDDIYERMAQGVYSAYRNDDPAYIDERTGMDKWRENKDATWIGNVFDGMQDRAAELAGGIVELANIGAKAAGWEDSEEYLGKFAEYLRDQDFGYEEWTTWSDVKDKKSVGALLAYAFEKGLVSAPDMLAVAFMPKLRFILPYIAARTGEIAQERSEQDMRDAPDGLDVMAALPVATASALLERLALEQIPGFSTTRIGREISKRKQKMAEEGDQPEPARIGGRHAVRQGSGQGRGCAGRHRRRSGKHRIHRRDTGN